MSKKEVVSTVVDEEMSVVIPEEEVVEASDGVSEVAEVAEDEEFDMSFDGEYENPPIDNENILEVEMDFGEMDVSNYKEPPVSYDARKGIALVDDEIFDGFVDEDGYIEIPVGEVDKKGRKKVERVKAVKVKKKKTRKNFIIGTMFKENFGALIPYIDDVNVTDINWNGIQLWVDDVKKGRYLSDVKLNKEFVEGFAVRVSNVVSRTFNKYSPRLEAETDELRITVLHESVSHTGTAISIRKTPAVKRINFMQSIKEGSYCSEETANFLSNSVKAKMNIAICGLPGVGKTELVKFLTNYIAPRDRVITVEDTMEIHYSKVNPGKDCLELKVEEHFSYTDAIKVSLRLLPEWIILSEARSKEVKYLLESVSTGAKCITTIHTDDVRKIPERVVNMLGEVSNVENIENTVYNFFNLGIYIDKKQDEETGRVERWISQVCLFSREDGVNKCSMILDKGILHMDAIPSEMLYRYNKAGISDPFAYTYVKMD